MKNDRMEQLKKEYMDTPIPDELDFLVRKTLKESGVNVMKKNNLIKKISVSAASVAAAVVILTVGVNSSPVFAETMSKVPVVGGLVKVLTFKEYTVKEDTFDANIKVPAVEGLENKELQSSLNEKYMEENKKLYDDFKADMEKLKKEGGGHMGVDSGYEVKTDNDRILSVGRYVVNTVGSSSTTYKFDTIDKKKEVLITLPGLFKDEGYVEVISENIKKQMLEQNKADENKIYWVKGIEKEMETDLFEKIKKDQNFYINKDGKLVISFDKYEVAPGCMGVVEFVIPTDVIKDMLVGNEYIK